MNGHKVAVVGSANADLVLDIDHRPAPGETILGSDVVVTPGGKGANQAVAAGRLGGDVTFVGCLGEDGNGRLLRASLADAGVNLSGLRQVDAPTGIAIIMVTPDGENSIIVAPGANRHVTPGMLDEADQWREAAVVVLQLEIPLESVTKVATEARGRVVLNTAPAAELPAEVIALADPLVANESEAHFLLGDQGGDGVALAERLLGLGPRSVVLTLGPAGSVVAERTGDGVRTAEVPAQRVTAVDTTGAGDSFVGAMALRLSEGDGLPDAVRFATSVAAVSVGRRGAQDSFPTMSELEAGSPTGRTDSRSS